MRGRVRLSSYNLLRGLDRESGRGDLFEGTVAHYPPGSGEVTVHTNRGPIYFPDGDCRLVISEALNSRVFCLFSVHTHGMPLPNSKASAQRSIDAMLPGSDMLKFGDHVVLIKNPLEFTRRLGRTAEAGGHKWRGCDRVPYLPLSKQVGVIDRPGFSKPDDFKMQREWRAVISSPTGTPDPLYLEIGDLSDITSIHTSTELLQSITITIPRLGWFSPTLPTLLV